MVLHILWNSDRAIGTSAYSKVSYQTLHELRKLGHTVAHIPMGSAWRMEKMNLEGILMYPSGLNIWNEDVILEDYADFKCDLMVTLKEPWVFNSLYRYAINWCPFCPIDHSPVSVMMTSKLATAFRIIAISRFGQRELKNAGFESTYIPHAVYTDVFHPLPDKKVECKKLFGFNPDEFTVGIVARNQVRKMIPHMLKGYKLFLDRNPDVKSKIMLWTNLQAGQSDDPMITDLGVTMAPLIMEFGLDQHVIFPDFKLLKWTLPDWVGDNYEVGWDMCKLFNAFDVYLNASGGEGFSLTLVESQSCGTPVITTEYAAAPEQVGAGLTVKPSDYVYLTSPGTKYAVPSVDGVADALTKIYNADRVKLALKARRFAERYSWPNVLKEYWLPFLSEIEKELRPKITKQGVEAW